jgi:hypothetical protein
VRPGKQAEGKERGKGVCVRAEEGSVGVIDGDGEDGWVRSGPLLPEVRAGERGGREGREGFKAYVSHASLRLDEAGKSEVGRRAHKSVDRVGDPPYMYRDRQEGRQQEGRGGLEWRRNVQLLAAGRTMES